MNLTNAIRTAAKAHHGQVDKCGEPYILHPLAVMGMMDTEPERIIAVLHDVVEDTWVSLFHLRFELFSDEIVDAVDALTKRTDETNRQYMERVRANAIATKVKLADMAHNAGRLERLPRAEERDYLAKKYREQTAYLLEPKP